MRILVKRGDAALISVGLVITTLGVFLWSWASPSPHGYIELVFALPVICLGLLFIGGTLVSGHRDAKDLWFWLGALVFLAAIAPPLLAAGALVFSVVT